MHSKLFKRGLNQSAHEKYYQDRNDSLEVMVKYENQLFALLRQDRKDDLIRLYEDMRQEELVPKVNILFLVAGIYADRGLFKDAFLLVKEVERILGRDIRCLELRLTWYLKLKKYHSALLYLELYRKEGHKLSLNLYNRLIGGLFSAGLNDKAVELIKTMKEDNIDPDNVTYSILLKNLLERGEIENASALFESIKTTMGSDDSIITYYELILDSMARNASLEDVLSFYQKMLSKGVIPSVITYTILTHAFTKANRPNDVLELYQNIKDNINLDMKYYNSLVLCLVKAGRMDDCLDVVDALKRKNMMPDMKMYSILIVHLLRNENLEEATTLYSEMHQQGYTPDELFKSLIQNSVDPKMQKLFYSFADHN